MRRRHRRRVARSRPGRTARRVVPGATAPAPRRAPRAPPGRSSEHPSRARRWRICPDRRGSGTPGCRRSRRPASHPVALPRPPPRAHPPHRHARSAADRRRQSRWRSGCARDVRAVPARSASRARCGHPRRACRAVPGRCRRARRWWEGPRASGRRRWSRRSAPPCWGRPPGPVGPPRRSGSCSGRGRGTARRSLRPPAGRADRECRASSGSTAAQRPGSLVWVDRRSA